MLNTEKSPYNENLVFLAYDLRGKKGGKKHTKKPSVVVGIV